MRKLVLATFFLGYGTLLAQPGIIPINFLNAEPEKLCQSYLDHVYQDETMWFVNPSGGALVRVSEYYGDLNMYIFCDASFHNLLIFSLVDSLGQLRARGLRGYGLQAGVQWFHFGDSIPSTRFRLSFDSQSGTGYFRQPVDVAVSSCGRYFDPETDRIYALDQGNHRVVVLRYDNVLDSLIWEGSFGQNYLKFPTALDYADYGDTDPDNDDIYVTDGLVPGIIRFSKNGVKEAQFSGWGSSMAAIGYPTGIAVSTSLDFPDRIYVTDSKNHRIVRYYSKTDGPIEVENQYVFSLVNSTPFVSAVDTDPDGNVYVINSFGHDIFVLKADLSSIVEVYGKYGFEQGMFNSPKDIYIDGYQMQICEFWDDSSGVQSLLIQPGYLKPESGVLPMQFALHQNYPNPFNSNTIISFDLPVPGSVELIIYNILGQKVITLADQSMPAGSHSLVWNGRNSDGRTVSSGIYFARLKANDRAAIKKLILLK